MSPSSRRFSETACALAAALSAAFSLTACAGSAGTGPVNPDDARRKPDGVAVDPASSPPPPRASADVVERLVTLRTPLGIELAMATIDELFQRIVREDVEGVEALCTKDAQAIGTAGSPTQRASVAWAHRFQRLDYTKLAGEVIYRPADVSVYRAEDVAEGFRPMASSHEGNEALDEDDLLVRVPIATPRIGQDRLFGEELVVWLRRDGAQYRIYRMLEDFQLP